MKRNGDGAGFKIDEVIGKFPSRNFLAQQVLCNPKTTTVFFLGYPMNLHPLSL